MNKKEIQERKQKVRHHFIQHYLAPFKYLFTILIIIHLIFALFNTWILAINGLVIDNFILNGKNAEFILLAIFYVTVTGIISVFLRINFIVKSRITQGIMYRIREDCFAHLQKLSFSYYDKNTVGDLLTRITADAKTYSRIIVTNWLTILNSCAFILGVVAYMLYLNWKVALIMFTAFPLSYGLSVVFRKKLFRGFRHIMEGNSKLTTAYNEGITGIQTIRSLSREKEFLEKFHGISDEVFFHSMRNRMTVATFMPFIIISTGLGSGLLLWFGGEEVLVGMMSIGTLIRNIVT